jgi:O-antigen/teichoic acid export membrane protein
LNGLTYKIRLKELKKNIPYFIPLTLGTIRIKIDTYFANSFFTVSDLGKYQILISFISIGHIATTYFVNPYLKVFFRVRESIIKKIKKQFFVFGVFYGLAFVIATYFIINNVYLLQFSFINYLTVFTFFIPLLFQMILVNQIYKYDKQNLVSYAALFVIILQLSTGYFLILEQGIQGALLLKAASQWLITLLLWFWYRKVKVNKLN